MKRLRLLSVFLFILGLHYSQAQYEFDDAYYQNRYGRSSYTSYRYTPPPKPYFSSSRVSAYASINSSGSVRVRGYGATLHSYSPSRFSPSSSSVRRSIYVRFVVPSGYSNSGQTIYKTIYATQPAKPKPAFNTSAAGASVSINSAGSVSVRGYGATVTSYSHAVFQLVTAASAGVYGSALWFLRVTATVGEPFLKPILLPNPPRLDLPSTPQPQGHR